MSVLKDALEALRTAALITDRLERHDEEIRALAADLRAARERLVAVETIIAFARGAAPRLPRRD
ncbi:MAG: hypothetical protein ACREPF_07080 [Rhodanobacteraceae bacterium]